MVDLVEAESSSDGCVRKFNGLLALLVEHDGLGPLFVEKVALGSLCLPEDVRAIGELDDGKLTLSVGGERAHHFSRSNGHVVVDHVPLGSVGNAYLGSLEGGISLRGLSTVSSTVPASAGSFDPVTVATPTQLELSS